MKRTLAAAALTAGLMTGFSGAAMAADPDLAAALRSGGYVLLVQPEAETGEWAERSALVLGPAARTQARTVGAALNALQVPIDAVLTAADARSVTTARLAFEDHAPAVGQATGRSRVTPPRPGTNTVVVAPGLPGVKGRPGTVAILAGSDEGYRVVRLLDPVDLARMTSF
jgi:hypothetical protein